MGARRYKARNVRIIIHSASDLPNPVEKNSTTSASEDEMSKMEVYAKVSINTATEKQKRTTPVDRDGDNNPAWHFDMRFTVRESAVKEPGVMLVFKLYCKRLRGREKNDLYIGEVSPSLEELFRTRDDKDGGDRDLPLTKGCLNSNSNGNLKFRYKFGKTAFMKKHPLVCKNAFSSLVGELISTAIGSVISACLCNAAAADDDDDDDDDGGGVDRNRDTTATE